MINKKLFLSMLLSSAVLFTCVGEAQPNPGTIFDEEDLQQVSSHNTKTQAQNQQVQQDDGDPDSPYDVIPHTGLQEPQNQENNGEKSPHLVISGENSPTGQRGLLLEIDNGDGSIVTHRVGESQPEDFSCH